MSQVGYYRYKLNDLTVGTRTITFFKNGTPSGSKTIDVKEWCEGNKILKFLDRNGQYRFYPFNRYWETKDKPKLIGKASKIIESVLDSQSNTSNVGYKNTRTISLVAENVSETEMSVLADIYSSPRVFMYVGEDTDLAKDWIQVEIKKGGQVSLRKANFGKIELDVILPEWYTIRMT